MDLNRTCEKVRDNKEKSKRKVKRSHSSEDEDEDGKPTNKRKKWQHCLENISPTKNSLLPTDQRNFSEFDESTELNKQKQRGGSGSTGYANGLLDLQIRLQRNFKMLKIKMEPSGLTTKFHEIGLLDSKSVDNIQRGDSRRIKNETLIKELCKLKRERGQDAYYEMFVSFLEGTGQGHIVSELVNSQKMNQRHVLDIQHNERKNLLRFASEMEDVILEEVEPRVFADEIVVIGGISIDDHDNITTQATRRERIHVLLEKIKSSKSSFSIRIVQKMVEAYPGLYKTFKQRKKGHMHGTKEPDVHRQNDLVSIESSVQIKFNITDGNSVVVEDTNEHDDPMSKMKRRRQQVKEIERQIVNDLNEDSSQLEATLLESCITGLEKVTFSSVKIYLKALSKNSLDKLVTFSRSSSAKKLFLSLIDEEARQKLLDMKVNIIVEITSGCQNSVANGIFETDCLCTLNTKKVATNRQALMAGIRCSRAIIKRFVDSQLTDANQKEYLKKISQIPDRKERNTKLLRFILDRDRPNALFCILEDEIIKHGGAEIIRATIKDQEEEETNVFSKADIQVNKQLLLEELEIHWFISNLEKRKDKDMKEILVKIRSSKTREEKIGTFIDYLSEPRDVTWFFEEIRRKHAHLFDTLLTRNTNYSERLDFRRLEVATRFYFDDIIEEVDPLLLETWLGNKTKEEVHLSKLTYVHERSKRASRFCISLLGVCPTSLCDVLNAMKAFGYKEIFEGITSLALEGPLNTRYNCPKIQSIVQCVETCVFKTSFSLDVNSAEDLAQLSTSSKIGSEKTCLEDDTDSLGTEDECKTTITQNSTLSGTRSDKAVYEDSPTIRFKESRELSLKEGSESGIFSGSGIYIEDVTIDKPDIDKSKRTEEWIESHTKSDSFGIFKQPGFAAHMSTDETRGVSQSERGTLKPKVTERFTLPFPPL